MYERPTGASEPQAIAPRPRRARGLTRRSALLAAAFSWTMALAIVMWLAEGLDSGVLVVHSKGQIAGAYFRSVDPAGFRVAFCLGLAGLAFCTVVASWCTWRVFRPSAR